MQRTETRHLPCALTGTELLAKGETLSKGLDDLRKLEKAKAESTRVYGERIKDLRRDLAKVAEEVRTRTEVRPIECRRVAIWAERKVAIVRTDTGELVEERPMTAAEIEAERQTTIFGDMEEGPETRESRMLPPSTRDEDEDADSVH